MTNGYEWVNVCEINKSRIDIKKQWITIDPLEHGIVMRKIFILLNFFVLALLTMK